MEQVLLAMAQWLDAVGIAPWVKGSASAYPIVNVAHVMGSIALVGAIGVVDLRLAGLWRALPAEPLVRALTPLAVGGLAAMVASGVLLFAADGAALAKSWVFQIKLALVAAAVANALFFRWRWRRRGEGAPALAIVSLALWVAVVVAGRMIAYT